MSPTRLSLPKEKIRILLLEGIADSALERLADAGYATVKRETKALDGPALTSRRSRACTCWASGPAPR
jgi:D-3-phosphoglycerate dehydrogenase